MIAVVPQFVTGPFETETPYKKACMERLTWLHQADTWVRIETEETEPGMPDTVRISNFKTVLIEYKVSNKYGVIKFKPTQPLWYRQNRDTCTYIFAWDKRYGRTIIITPDEIIRNAKLTFQLPERIDEMYGVNDIKRW